MKLKELLFGKPVNEAKKEPTWKTKHYLSVKNTPIGKKVDSFKGIKELKAELKRAQIEFNQYKSAIEGRIETMSKAQKPKGYDSFWMYADAGRYEEPRRG